MTLGMRTDARVRWLPIRRVVIATVLGISLGILASVWGGTYWPWLVGAGAVATTIALVGTRVLPGVLAWVAIQNTVLPYAFTRLSLPTRVWTYSLMLSELATVLALLLWVPVMSRSRKVPQLFFYLIAFFVCSALPIAMHEHGSSFALLNYFRQLAIPLLFGAAGYVYVFGHPDRVAILCRVVVWISVAGAVGAFVDKSLPTSFWTNFGLGNYWIVVKGLPLSYVRDGLPLNMFEVYGQSLIRRAISFYGDPLAAGYSMAIGMAALMWLWERGEANLRTVSILTLALVAGVALTDTRAAYVEIGLLVTVPLLWNQSFRARVPRGWVIAVLTVLVGLGFTVIVQSLLGRNSSISAHLASFSLIPEMIRHPLGINLSGAPEGLAFHVWWTSGLLGLASLALLVEKMGQWLLSSRQFVPFALLLGVAATSFISIEWLGDTSCGAGWALLGAATYLAELAT